MDFNSGHGDPHEHNIRVMDRSSHYKFRSTTAKKTPTTAHSLVSAQQTRCNVCAPYNPEKNARQRLYFPHSIKALKTTSPLSLLHKTKKHMRQNGRQDPRLHSYTKNCPSHHPNVVVYTPTEQTQRSRARSEVERAALPPHTHSWSLPWQGRCSSTPASSLC